LVLYFCVSPLVSHHVLIRQGQHNHEVGTVEGDVGMSLFPSVEAEIIDTLSNPSSRGTLSVAKRESIIRDNNIMREEWWRRGSTS
jgi:hypothetical protein